ncbi:MAG: hypothetical protein LBD06_00240, partial [Candidatus Accumulibacter sp.]|nr:hypothetical protein [Accumulibacter sp.]
PPLLSRPVILPAEVRRYFDHCPCLSGFRGQKTEDRSACGAARRAGNAKPSARFFHPIRRDSAANLSVFCLLYWLSSETVL